MSVSYIFDVDGVLCEKGAPIDSEFEEWFLSWMIDKEIHIVTGSERSKVIEQINDRILSRVKIGFYCLGNCVYINGQEVLVNQFVLKDEEKEFLENYLKDSPYPVKTGNHIELRRGTINFSVLGKNATEEQRLHYERYDSISKEREKFIDSFTKKFPRFQAYIGGRVSIDICLRGANKSQILSMTGIKDQMYFFGDRCFPYGVDYPLVENYFTLIGLEGFNPKAVGYQIDNGYKQTWEILKTL